MENTITLSHEQKKLVEKRIQSGAYTSEREVITDGLNLLDKRDQFLLEKALAGMNSGKSVPAEEVFARIEKKLEKRSSQQK